MNRLSFYRLLDYIFPESYRLKLFFVAFIGIHVPIISLMIWILARHGGVEAHISEILIILAATAIGTVFTLGGILFILSPVEEATAALKTYQTERRIAITRTIFKDTAGRLYNGVFDVLTEVENLLRERERLATTDTLTEVFNRRGFESNAKSFIGKKDTIYLAIFDIDHFKAINDNFGHPKGDEVLSQFSRVLKECACGTHVIGRLGGEEFAIMFVNSTEDDVVQSCDQIRYNLSRLPLVSHAVTTSVGLARAEDGESLSYILSRADGALYKAKKDGRNRMVKADPL